MWANISSSWAQQCTNIQILFVFSFFVPNSLARRCKLVAHLLWFFSKSWLRCNAALLVFFFFRYAGHWVYFSVPGSFFTQGSSLTLLALLYAFLVVFSSLFMLLYMCFSAEFFCCARLFFSSSFFSLSVFLLLYSVHALFSLYYSCFFVSYFYLVFCVVSCALRAMFLSKLFCNIVSYITVL